MTRIILTVSLKFEYIFLKELLEVLRLSNCNITKKFYLNNLAFVRLSWANLHQKL
jgi:hypothetical protein